jgi:hypothetical protein
MKNALLSRNVFFADATTLSWHTQASTPAIARIPYGRNMIEVKEANSQRGYGRLESWLRGFKVQLSEREKIPLNKMNKLKS